MYNIDSIKWIKNVTDRENNGAYLNVHDEFDLHFPNHHRGNVLAPQINDIVLIFQTIDNDIKFTHLVSPIDNILHEDGPHQNYHYYRKVKLIAGKLNEPYISRNDSILRDINFAGMSQGNAVQLGNVGEIIASNLLESIKLDILSLFYNYINYIEFSNPLSYEDRLFDNDLHAEGNKILIHHYAYERDYSLISQKKTNALKNGSLQCEVCNFNFFHIYGQSFIECHHKTPLSNNIVRNTTLDDLALVCSNCHRMLHRRFNNEYKSIDELRLLINV